MGVITGNGGVPEGGSTDMMRLLFSCVTVAFIHACSATTSDEASFLAAFNSHRYALSKGLVTGQPCATNLGNLTWDDTLASLAKTYSARCTYVENTARTSEYQAANGTGTVSESVWYGTNGNALDAVTAWWDQRMNYTYNSTTSGLCTSQPCHDYMKIVSANVTRVGCGYSACNEVHDSTGTTIANSVVFVVCN